MELLSSWLSNHGLEAHKKALDYLNNKGFFAKNSKNSDLDQIREIEKRNSRELYFKDCTRKLKNNIRQQKSLEKQPMVKQHTFRISTQAHDAIKSIAENQSMSKSAVLERMIMKEYSSMQQHGPCQYNQRPHQQTPCFQNSPNRLGDSLQEAQNNFKPSRYYGDPDPYGIL